MWASNVMVWAERTMMAAGLPMIGGLTFSRPQARDWVSTGRNYAGHQNGPEIIRVYQNADTPLYVMFTAHEY